MNAARQQQLLSGNTTVARKIFEFVPITDSWNPSEIATAMKRSTGSMQDIRTIDACLRALVDSGVVVETPNRGFFRRKPVRVPDEHGVTSTHGVTSIAPPAVAIVRTATPPTPPTPAVEITPLETLALLAKRVRRVREMALAVSDECGEICTELEDVAIQIEQERDADRVKNAKFGELQALLKSMTA